MEYPLVMWVIDVDGSNQKIFLEWTTGIIVWSPDRRKALIIREYKGGLSDICIMNADGLDVRDLGIRSPMFGDIWSPVWSPDGTRVAFSSLTGFEVSDIFVVNADGSNVRQITKTPDIGWDQKHLVGWAAFPYSVVKYSGKLISTWGNIKDFGFSE